MNELGASVTASSETFAYGLVICSREQPADWGRCPCPKARGF